MAGWSRVAAGVWSYADSCNVYAFEAPRGMVLINAGTGEWLPHLEQLPKGPVALACTHYFRDHSAGAAGAAEAGIPIYVPASERALFEDPEQHFRQRASYIVYDNIWDTFSPIEPIPVAGVLEDYARVELGGAPFEVVPLPGVTPGQVGLATTLPDGRKAVFCGEAIHSAGKVPRIAPYQYNYNDLSGCVNAHYAAGVLRGHRPKILFPSLGTPITQHVDNALQVLQTNLEELGSVRPALVDHFKFLHGPDFYPVTPHVWQDGWSMCNNWYLISESGKVLAIDYGYHVVTAAAFPGYAKPERRRALIHTVDALKKKFGADRIDVVLVSHFHDDHVAGIPVLQRVYGTECWAADIFADLLEFPEAHNFPCNWPVPCRVDRRLPPDQPFQWEEFTFRLHPMNGHTRFSALIGFEADGKRFAHTGDQYFFHGGVQSFAENRRMMNHVFRNGALLNGYRESGKWMLDWRPDIVLTGHAPPMHTDEFFFNLIADWNHDYADLARGVMPLEDSDVHFNLDSWGGWIWPYRVVIPSPQRFTVRVTVRNPMPHPATVDVRLVGPKGWEGESKSLHAAPRAEVSSELSMNPAGPCRMQPIAVDLRVDGRPFGQVAEALVTVG